MKVVVHERRSPLHTLFLGVIAVAALLVIGFIVLDVYEHAYFMDYGSDKKAYIAAFWKNFNWAKAEELYLSAREIR